MLASLRAVARSRITSLCSRHYSGNSFIDTLLRNHELTAADARNELRWIRQATSSEAEVAELVRRRSEGEPLQYILGNTDFGSLTLLTRPPVLIPRPETAHIVEDLASRILLARQRGACPPKLNVLDLCTGSGCIPLLLSNLLGESMGRAYGVDISPHAISLARDNIEQLSDNRVSVFQADIFAADFVDRIRESTRGIPIHIITSNPPYIPPDEYAALPSSVRDYEDQGALLAGPVDGVAGVAFYGHIASLAPQILDPEKLEGIPRIAVEIGAEQGTAVSKLLPGSTQVVRDQYGRDRMVLSML